MYCLNLKTKEMKLVKGTEKAPKSQFVVMNGKVYTYRTGKIGGIIEISPDQEEARKINFPYTLSPQINDFFKLRLARGKFKIR